MSQLDATALKQNVDDNITTNANEEITGAKANEVLTNFIDSCLNFITHRPYLMLQEHNTHTSYKIGEAMIRLGIIYQANQNTVGAFNPSKWDVISASNLFIPRAGTAGSPITGPLEFDPAAGLTSLYANGDFVIGYCNAGNDLLAALSYAASYYGANGGGLFYKASTGEESQVSVGKSSGLLSFFTSAGFGGDVTITEDYTNVGYTGNNVGIIQIDDLQMTLAHSYSSFQGLQYAADYSANFIARSLVDYGWSTAQIAALQSQINNINSGMAWKNPCRVMCDTNVTIATPGANLDGIPMVAGDRVLVTGQTTGHENGLYVYQGAAVAMTRADDCNTGTEILQATCGIQEGTYADQIWTCSTDAPIVIGVTSIAFIKTSATTYTASNGITLTGNNFTLNNSYFSGDATIIAGVITIGAGKVVHTMLASMTSVQFAAVISDETGTGALVFANAPTLVNPIVGTQAANDNSTKAASTAYVDAAISTETAKVQELVPTTDQTTTLATSTAVTGISFAAAANSVYKIEGCIHHGCNNTGGTKFDITTPAGATLFIQLRGFLATATDGGISNSIVAPATLNANAFCQTSNANGRVTIYGTITTGGTAGTVALGFASGTAGQTSTFYKEGSVITITKIA
jgi:hypothetical protein